MCTIDNNIIDNNINVSGIEKIKTPFAKITARISSLGDVWYYEIMYYDPSDKQIHVGWGSHSQEFVMYWLNKFFEIDRSTSYSLRLVPWCGDCRYNNGRRVAKCSCCRRNLYIKDCYEPDDAAADAQGERCGASVEVEDNGN